MFKVSYCEIDISNPSEDYDMDYIHHPHQLAFGTDDLRYNVSGYLLEL